MPLPSQIERFVRLPRRRRRRQPIRFIMLDDLVVLFLDRVFPGFRMTGQGLFRLIRDTDVEFEEEAEDLVRSYETALKRRRRGVAIHLEIDAGMPQELRELVVDELDAAPDEIHDDQRPAGPRRPEAADRRRPPRPAVPALHAALPRTHPRFRRRLLRRDPRQGHHRPPSVRKLRRGGAVPAPGRAGPGGHRDQADAVPHQPRQPDRQGADRGGGGRQVGHRDGRAARPLRRRSEYPAGAHAWKPPACRWCSASPA